MKYIESPSCDAYFNMALEEYVFESLPRDEEYFMLWRNRNAVVVGKYQNTAEEINAGYIREHGIAVVRRLSGGGAMYQDMGNLNFTFIVDQNTAKDLDFSIFIQPVIDALQTVGVRAECNSRNDITIGGKKISGNSQYNKHGRTMHHGTLLFQSDLNAVDKALCVKQDKIESKGVKSVRSRVTNICDHLERDMTVQEFQQVLLAHIFCTGALEEYRLTESDLQAVCRLRDERYATWQWNYGKSPAYDLKKERRYLFGGVTLYLNIKDGAIQKIGLRGDFFGNGGVVQLEQCLQGVLLTEQDVDRALSTVDVPDCIQGMDARTLRDLILYD